MLTLITDKTLSTGQCLSLLHQHIHPWATFPWWYLIWHFSCLSLCPHLFTSLTDLHPVFLLQKMWLALFGLHWVLLFLWENRLYRNHLVCLCRKNKVKIQHELLLSLTFSTFASQSAVTQMLTSSFLFLPLSLSPPFLLHPAAFFPFYFSKSLSFLSNKCR